MDLKTLKRVSRGKYKGKGRDKNKVIPALKVVECTLKLEVKEV